MPFSENSMGQVGNILDFHRLNVMTTLGVEFVVIFFIVKLDYFFSR